MGPHTHPPSHRPLTPSTWLEFGGITTEKVWNCKGHRRVSEAQPGQNFVGENWGQSRNLWREVPENWGQSPNRDREGKRSGREFNEPLPENLWKFKLEPLQAIWCTVSTTFYIFSRFYFFFSMKRWLWSSRRRRRFHCFLFRWERWLWSSRRRGRFIEGRSADGWFWGVVPLKRCANSKIKMVLSWKFLIWLRCIWSTLST